MYTGLLFYSLHVKHQQKVDKKQNNNDRAKLKLHLHLQRICSQCVSKLADKIIIIVNENNSVKFI